jgi:cyclopropane-fatty-acyl-phospholipid synthase
VGGYKGVVQRLLSQAGVEIDGSSPWDIQVHNPGFYRRIITQGSLGLGESYMEGWWTCVAIDQFFHRIISADLHKQAKITLHEKISILFRHLFNVQTRSGSMKVVNEHYNQDSEIIQSFLDPYNQYSCGYFKETDDLNIAQQQKLDLICKKLMLSANDTVLDIGCGWGGFARFAAERYSCEVTGISISSEQIEYAKKFCEGLPVSFVKSDYRDFRGSFTKVLICGMIEHVGYKNYRTIMKMVNNCLEDNGLFLLQTNGGNTSVVLNDPWVAKYFFPNSMFPSLQQTTRAVEGLFMLEDLHSFGEYYDPTLMAWHENFTRNWPNFKDRYNERFFRMWTYYFLHLAGCYRARKNQLWQFVFSKKGIPGGYASIR